VPRVRGVAWAFVDQSFSSLTNFALVLITGRLLGPANLGVVAIGFAAYLLALILYRAIVTTPLVVLPGSARQAEAVTRRGLGVTLLLSAGTASAFVGLGIAIPGDIGKGLLLFSPWIAPSLIQDAWRTILFRDARGSAAALNDAAWLLTMAVATPAVLAWPSTFSAVSWWGCGAVVGTILGFFQTGYMPDVSRKAWEWWRRDMWPLGKWLAVDRVVMNVGTQLPIVLAGGFLAPRAVGGFRAIQSLFAPLSLLGPTVTLPGLPALERSLRASTAAGWKTSTKIGGLVTLATIAYIAAIFTLGPRLVSYVFGPAFATYRTLAFPVAFGQVFLALGTGVALLLQANKTPRPLILARTFGSVVMLSGTWILGHRAGISGVAWSISFGFVVTTVLLYPFAWRTPSLRAADGRTTSSKQIPRT
jgi:O-antigen/teichoic acid export membrane protein